MVLDRSAWNLPDNSRHTTVLYDLHALAASTTERESGAGGRKGDYNDSDTHARINADTGSNSRVSAVNADTTSDGKYISYAGSAFNSHSDCR